MRRKEREITDRAEQEAVLDRGGLLHLAMTSEGAPYIVPMNYGRAGACVYLHCANKGKKLEALDADNRVALNVVGFHRVSSLEKAKKACDLTTYFESVTVFGRAFRVTDPDERLRGFTAILRHHAAEHLPLEDLPGVVILRVEIEQMTGKHNTPPADEAGPLLAHG